MVAYNRKLKRKWKGQVLLPLTEPPFKIVADKNSKMIVITHGQEEGVTMAGIFGDVFLCGSHNSNSCSGYLRSVLLSEIKWRQKGEVNVKWRTVDADRGNIYAEEE
jgi:hypothetical protein